MTNGADPTSAGSVAQTGAPAVPPPAQPPPMTPAPAGTPATPGMISVPQEQLGPWGGRFGEVIREANAFRSAREAGLLADDARALLQELQTMNTTPAEFLTYMRQNQTDAIPEPPAEATNAAPGPGPETPAPLSRDDVRQIMVDVLREQGSQGAEQQRLQQARNAEWQTISEALKAGGYELDAEGRPANKKSKIALAALHREINDAIAESAPIHLSGAEREKFIREAQDRPAGPLALKAAIQGWAEGMADFGNEKVAAFAQQQEGLPPATLGGGPTGGVPAKDVKDMTPEEEEEIVMAETEKKMGRPVDPNL